MIVVEFWFFKRKRKLVFEVWVFKVKVVWIFYFIVICYICLEVIKFRFYFIYEKFDDLFLELLV